jgi:hypothetical protein
MPRNVPLTAEQIAAVVAAIKGGTPRNAISRQLNIGRGSVSKIAKDHGLEHHFDRSATVVATQAKQADAAALRAALELAYLDDAARLREQLWQPITYAELGQFAEGGEKESRFVEHTQNKPAPADQLKLMQASTTAAAASQRIADSRGESGVGEVASMLGNLATALGQAFRDMQAEDLTTPTSQETAP